MPEGDSLHLAARRLQVLVGQRIAAASPHPRAQAERIAEQIDGRTLESVHARGKNLVLRFEGGIVLRSHLRMSGRWTVRPRGEARAGKPWLVLRGTNVEGVLWNGPVLETAAELMRASVDTGRGRRHQVYRRVGQPCPRCRTTIRSWGQGDGNRTAYWCPGCQAGDDPRRS